ncbi:unnamed protein product [Bathycoccus prasinos]
MSEPTDAQFGNKIKDMKSSVKERIWTSRLDIFGGVVCMIDRTEKEYTEYLLGNEDDEYGGMTPPMRTEY